MADLVQGEGKAGRQTVSDRFRLVGAVVQQQYCSLRFPGLPRECLEAGADTIRLIFGGNGDNGNVSDQCKDG